MQRNIIEIDREKCNGCGLCVNACHEGALEMQEGKAVLVSDSYCDGLGDCLPKCPTDAIKIIRREADDFDKELVMKRMEDRKAEETRKKQFIKLNDESPLKSWPLQIKLASPKMAAFDGADLLIAADCTAFAYKNFHNEFLAGKVALIGCPKLDEIDYSEALTNVLKMNDIKSVTVLRMEVPCCSGMANAAKKALENCGKNIPWSIHTISTVGELLG